VLDGRRLYFAISAIYALTRGVLFGLGLRYHADYGWQHFHDVDLLRDRLWESLLYTHAFTPFLDLLAGVVMKISEAHAAAIYHAIFLVLGCTSVNALGHVLVSLGLGRRTALGVVTFFSLTPAFLFFENLLHYEFITASLVMLSAALFLEALRNGSFRRWFWFFLVCAVITLVRTSFHLVWLFAMLALALAFQRERWRSILLAVLLPLALSSSLWRCRARSTSRTRSCSASSARAPTSAPTWPTPPFASSRSRSSRAGSPRARSAQSPA
jgi:hypothetical protein